MGIAIAGLVSDARVLRYENTKLSVEQLRTFAAERSRDCVPFIDETSFNKNPTLPFHMASSNFMRTECMKSKMMYDRPMPGSRLVSLIGDSTYL